MSTVLPSSADIFHHGLFVMNRDRMESRLDGERKSWKAPDIFKENSSSQEWKSAIPDQLAEDNLEIQNILLNQTASKNLNKIVLKECCHHGEFRSIS